MLSRAVASVFFEEHRPPKMLIHGLCAGVARDSCLPCKRYCRAASRAAACRAACRVPCKRTFIQSWGWLIKLVYHFAILIRSHCNYSFFRYWNCKAINYLPAWYKWKFCQARWRKYVIKSHIYFHEVDGDNILSNVMGNSVRYIVKIYCEKSYILLCDR